MKKVLIPLLAIISGLILGSLVNMSIISMSSSIIPPPKGIDTTTMEGLKNAMHLFKPKHFLMPFLAHALGTLIGALATSLIAKKYKKNLALTIGFFFLIGGITNIIMLPSPVWFTLTDLIGAYIPMALIGYFLSKKLNRKKI